MINFIVFALYICVGALLLIIWPIMLHPTLPLKRKIVISLITFFILIPGGLALYAWLGVPQLAAR